METTMGIKVKELAEMYGFKYSILEDIVQVTSKYGSWVVDTNPSRMLKKGKTILLLHDSYNVKSKYIKDLNKYHSHYEFYDLEWCFRHIYEHDRFKTSNQRIKSKREARQEDIFYAISTGDMSKFHIKLN